MTTNGERARPRGRATRVLLRRFQGALAATVVAAAGLAPAEAPAAAAALVDDVEAAKRATDEFNRGLEMLRQGDVAGLQVAKSALAALEAAVGADHPTTKQASAAFLMARFQVRLVRLRLALQNTTPTGPRMTSVWAVNLAKEQLRLGQEAIARGDRSGIAKIEQAYVYMLFAVRDPMTTTVSEYSGALSKAYRAIGEPARAEAIEDGEVPASAVVPKILLSDEMATLYQQADAAAQAREWARAADLQGRLVALLERELGGDAEELVQWWSDQALYLAAAGRVDEAEVLLARVEKQVLARYGAQSPRAREFYQQLATHFLFRGDVARANLYREKGWVLARKAPKNDPSVLRDLLQLADSRVARRNLAEARQVIAELEARFKAVGEVGAADRLRLVIVKVALLDEEGQREQATRLLLEAESLAAGIDDRSARFLYHRTAGEHARAAGEYPTAARHFGLAGEVGSVSAAVTSGMFESAAMMYWAAGRPEDAIKAADQAGATMDALLPALLISGTDSEKRQQLLFASLQVDPLVSLAADGFPRSADAAALGLRTLVRRKAVVLDAITRTAEVARGHGSDELLKTEAELHERLAGLVYHPRPAEFYDESERRELLAAIDAADQRLALAAQGAGPPGPPVSLDEIRARLPDQGALVEIAVYRPNDPRRSGKDQGADRRYVAFVLPKSGPVAAVPLAGAAEIDALVTDLQRALASPRGEFRGPAKALHEATIAKVAPHLGGAAHLVIAPDGALNLVPFAALVDEKGEFLIERYTITYAASGRELTRASEGPGAATPPVLVGAPAYDDPGAGARVPEGTRKALRFSPLPGTAQEVKALAAVVPGATLKSGGDAGEAEIKAIERPLLLHVATHGFFLAGTSDALAGARALEYDAGTPDAGAAATPPAWSPPQNPLLRSGLALAGANARVGRDDGILTALEVTSMDLRGTELVVLSACETGVGEVEGGEGVYGLRRALTIAGARAQVMSLWKVDDAATRDLMVGFYKKLAAGEGRGAALREAQRALLGDPKRAHPYYWAAFIPSGAWSPMRLTLPEPAPAPSGGGGGPDPSDRGRVRDYWKNPPKKPIFYMGGTYSAPIGVDPYQGASITQRSAFGVDLLFNVAPRWIAGLTYGRQMWDVGASDQRLESSSAKLARFEFVVGVDALGLPRGWRVRPSLNAWVAGGLAWTKQFGPSDRAYGLSGTFGADAQLHLRFTPRVDLRLGGGVTRSGYWIDKSTLAGAAKFGSAWRWMAGGALGIVF
ncbi:MAG: CHAT domain-containing protein [Nannocystaceae bacterium]